MLLLLLLLSGSFKSLKVAAEAHLVRGLVSLSNFFLPNRRLFMKDDCFSMGALALSFFPERPGGRGELEKGRDS